MDSQIAAQAAQVVQLEAIAANQRERLQSLTVRAPESGVLQDLTLQLGQWVPEGTVLAKVVQPGRLKAVLRVPESPQHPHPTHSRYSGTGLGVSTQSYSYGWFGAPPRKHWSRHFGFYRNYTQWSVK